jgi:hypothetical protein
MSARHVRWVLLALTVGLLVVAILLPASLPQERGRGWPSFLLLRLPLGREAAWLQTWMYVPALGVVTTLLPLLFPTGRLVSWRWRPALALAIIASIGVRDELDVEARSGDLRAMVHRTMRPSHLSLWLPGSGDRP